MAAQNNGSVDKRRAPAGRREKGPHEEYYHHRVAVAVAVALLVLYCNAISQFFLGVDYYKYLYLVADNSNNIRQHHAWCVQGGELD